MELLGRPSAWPGWPPVARIAVSVVVSMLNVSLAPAGEGRRRMFGFFFLMTTLGSVVNFGDSIGLHAAWQRWLVGIVLSFPFWLLFAINTPGRLKNRVDAWKERRSRR